MRRKSSRMVQVGAVSCSCPGICWCTFGQRLGGEWLLQVPLVLTPAAAPRRAVATMAACVSESSIQSSPSNKGKSLPAHLSHRDELINILAPPEHRRFSIEPALLEPNSEHDICGEGGLDALVLPSSPSGAEETAESNQYAELTSMYDGQNQEPTLLVKTVQVQFHHHHHRRRRRRRRRRHCYCCHRYRRFHCHPTLLSRRPQEIDRHKPSCRTKSGRSCSSFSWAHQRRARRASTPRSRSHRSTGGACSYTARSIRLRAASC